jgi:hypothetical protein
MIKEDIKNKIIDELYSRFKLIQNETPKKLTLGQNIEQKSKTLLELLLKKKKNK